MNILASEIIKPYIPKNFGREYCEIKGSSQYPMFIAAALGIKPVFDDWVDASRYSDYVGMCSKYSLVVEPDVVFKRYQQSKEKIVGGSNIATTYHSAKKFTQEENQGEVHVFISKTKEKAIEAKKFGWYPVIINNRSTNKPYMDNIRFGECLGFPDCCIDFFRRYNNWSLYSNPYEIFKNTPKTERKPTGSYYCNNFLMDNSYSLIHHLPCSYRCPNTIELAKKIEEKIKEVEPGFTEKAAEMLKKPLLVFGEKNFIIFYGTLKKQNNTFSIEYDQCQYFSNIARPEETIDFFESVKAGNNIIIKNNKLIIKDNNSILKTVEKKPEWFTMDFD